VGFSIKSINQSIMFQDLAKLEGLVTSVGAAALHGLDRADTQRKVDLVLQRVEAITKVRASLTLLSFR